MFIPKLNSKCVFKYPFDGGKKLLLAECFEGKKIALFFVCLATADSIYISVSPTKGSRFIIKNRLIKTTETKPETTQNCSKVQ